MELLDFLSRYLNFLVEEYMSGNKRLILHIRVGFHNTYSIQYNFTVRPLWWPKAKSPWLSGYLQV